MLILILIAIIFGSVCLDQVTKWLAVTFLKGESSFPLWKGVLHLTYVENRGAAFGMLDGHRWVFMVVSTVAIIGLAVYLFRFCKENMWVKVALAMIIGGGIGNMIDRIILQYVVDFIDFTLINFAVFNVADSFVTVGAGMLIGYFIREMILEQKTGRKKLPEPELPASGENSETVSGMTGGSVQEQAENAPAEGNDHDGNDPA